MIFINIKQLRLERVGNMQLTGRNIVYVGGFGGIGFAACKALLKQQLQSLSILDLKCDEEKLKQLLAINAQTAVNYVNFDLCAGKQNIENILQQLNAQVGGIDVLINGAGIINDRQPQLTVQINLLGLIETTLAAMPLMSLANGGRGGIILNMGSVLSLEAGPFIAVYTATKHAVLGFTRSLAHAHYFETTGIAHLLFCPGPTRTNLLQSFVGLDTLEISKPLSEHYLTALSQDVNICAEHLVHVLQQAINGSVWLSDLGQLRQIKLHEYWQYTFDTSN